MGVKEGQIMPLFVPVILGVTAFILGATGVKKGVDGVSDLRRAQELGDAAEYRHARMVRAVDAIRDDVTASAAAYGNYKLETRRESFSRLLRLMEKLERKGGLDRVSFLKELDLRRDVVEAFRAEAMEAQQVASGLLQAGLGGATAASAAYGLAGSIGVASTGAAISGLSGAAATSASLAWLGGGSLAAGGFGMAGGMVVLGGVVAGPALALGGFIIADRGERALTEAYAYDARVNRAIEDMETVAAFMRQVQRRIGELCGLVTRLRKRLDARLEALEASADRWSVQSAADRERLREAMQVAAALSEVIRTPVVDGSNRLTLESASVVAHYETLAS